MTTRGGSNPWQEDGALGSSATDETALQDTGVSVDPLPDISALLPPESLTPEVSWAPTLGELFPEGFENLHKFGAVVDGLGLPGAFIPLTVACAADMQYEDLVEIIETIIAYNLGDNVIEMDDPCQIRRMASIGTCVARRGLGISFVPDLQEFWLDGKAADPANLRTEQVQFPPDARGIPTDISYYPMGATWFFGRVGNEVETWTAGAQEAFVWHGIRDRVRAAPDAVFPSAAASANDGDVTFLRDQVTIGAGPSTLHTTGRDWLYPKETWVRFKHWLQGVNDSGQEIIDQELFMAGGMSITSEVEVSAEPATLRVGDTDIAGWTARILSWRIRVADRIDYEPGETQFLPMGTGSLELPDDLFLELQNNGCPGFPTPVDFDIVSDAWHDMPLGRLVHDELFIASQPYADATGSAFGGDAESYDYFDPATQSGVNLVTPR